MSQSVVLGSNGSVGARGRAGTATVSYALLVVAALSLWPTLRTLEAYWRGIHDYQHGYLIAAVVVGWLYTRRQELGAIALRPSWPATLLLAGAIAVWLVAVVAASHIGQQLLLPIVLGLAVWAGAGRRAAHALLRPLAYLYFAVPIWDFLVPTLQHLTVLAAQTAMSLVGVPTVVRDFTVSIPEGTFAIIEGCSGKKYLLAALATAALAAVLGGLDRRRFAALLVIAATLAVLTNWLRVITVIVVGHLSHMQNYLVRVEHRSFGNALWLLLLIAILWIARRLSPPVPAAQPSRDEPAIAPALGRRSVFSVAPALLLIGGAWLAHFDTRRSPLQASLPPLPVAAAAWQGPLPGSAQWWPRYVGAASERHGAYSNAAGTIEIYANLYADQAPGRKLVAYQNELLGPGDWQPTTANGAISVRGSLLGGRPRVLTAFDSEGRRWVVSYSYFVGGARSANDAVAQLLYGLFAVVRVPPSGMFALAARCADDSCDGAGRLVASFWDAMHEPLGEFLAAAARSSGAEYAR